MDNKNIFLSQTDQSTDNNDIAGKITYTNIIEEIPKNKLTKQIKNWEKQYKTEWRWRFLKDKERRVVEISYINRDTKQRMYFNKYGNWTKDVLIPQECDVLVYEEYYVYTNE